MEIEAHKLYGQWLESMDKASFTILTSIHSNYGGESREFKYIDCVNRLITDIKRIMAAKASEEHPGEKNTFFNDLYEIDSEFEKWKFMEID